MNRPPRPHSSETELASGREVQVLGSGLGAESGLTMPRDVGLLSLSLSDWQIEVAVSMRIRSVGGATLALLLAVCLGVSPIAPSPAAAVDPYFIRLHSTANNEKVWIRDNRDEWIEDDHNITFPVLERVVSWARSPRCTNTESGRALYRYRLYEYETRDGELVKTGQWVIVTFLIEWRDGRDDEGWLVTAYPTKTNSGPPPVRDGKSWMPNWATNSLAIGPVNHDRLCDAHYRSGPRPPQRRT